MAYIASPGSPMAHDHHVTLLQIVGLAENKGQSGSFVVAKSNPFVAMVLGATGLDAVGFSHTRISRTRGGPSQEFRREGKGTSLQYA